MSKNIIICCDGTGNQFGDRNSNVVKLYSVLSKLPADQIAYYDPGVGTVKSPGFSFSFKNKFKQIFGLSSGYGIHQNVFEAYSYLMENYEKDDKVFLFGFSRGAYTVRILSGFIHSMGLLQKGCQNLIPYAFQIYGQKKPDFATSAKFKSQFSGNCPIAFMGIWDTVSSVGYFGNWKSYPYTANNKNVSTIRHALAIDERRALFSHNKLGTNAANGQNIREVWFAGAHSDVGGSYDEMESGLSKISLQWMANEAIKEGLLIDPRRYARKVLANTRKSVGPNPEGLFHESLVGFWHILELIPKTIVNYKLNTKKRYIPLGRRRNIPESSFIHATVFERMQKLEYKPDNLPKDYQLEIIEENIVPRKSK